MTTQPVYEVITKENLTAAFKDALDQANIEVLSRLDQLIDAYSATAQPSLWVWGLTSRWGYDKWW